MTKELQIYFPNNIDLPLDYSNLVIGDEGCIYKAIDIQWVDFAQKAAREGFLLRYLTPVVPNKFIDETFQRINNLADSHKLKVTFNDYGLLYLCRELIKEERIIPVLGRILSRSIMDCGWHEHLLSNEDPMLIHALTDQPFSCTFKLEILKQYNIKEIELNLRGPIPTDILKENGITLSGYATNAIISVGRICFSARWHGLVLPYCTNDSRCKRELNIELTEMWGKKRLMYEHPSEEMKEYFKNHYIKGNIVYCKTDSLSLPNIYNGIDNFIY